jgi:hypothetical protein
MSDYLWARRHVSDIGLSVASSSSRPTLLRAVYNSWSFGGVHFHHKSL